MQEGNFDRDLSALANIMAVVNKVDISMIKFHQKLMQQHLTSHFESKSPPGGIPKRH